MTFYKSIKTDLINAGADWKDEEVVVDKELITSRCPNDLPAFCESIIKVIKNDIPVRIDEETNETDKK